MLISFGGVHDRFDALSHALHALDYSCGVGLPFGILPSSLDMSRKLIAGAFATDHMFRYLQLTRAAYRARVPTFGLMHVFINHEETQSGLGPSAGFLFFLNEEKGRPRSTPSREGAEPSGGVSYRGPSPTLSPRRSPSLRFDPLPATY